MFHKVALLMAAGVLWTAGAQAHHAFTAEFDPNKPVELSGTVVKVEWVNPHGWIHLNVKRKDGTEEAWAIETGTPNVLMRRGVTRQVLHPGVEVIIGGYQAKNGSKKATGLNMKFADGRSLFLGSTESGAPPAGSSSEK